MMKRQQHPRDKICLNPRIDDSLLVYCTWSCRILSINATGHRGWKPVVSLVAAAANKPTSELPRNNLKSIRLLGLYLVDLFPEQCVLKGACQVFKVLSWAVALRLHVYK